MFKNFTPHFIRISGSFPDRGKTITFSAAQLQQVKAIGGISGYSLVIEDKAMVQNGDLPVMVYMKGVDTNYQHNTGLPQSIIRGKFDLGNADQPLIVLGSGIENALRAESDRNILPMSVYLFKKGLTSNADPVASISNASVAASGTFAIQQEFDNKYVITNLAFMKRMLGLGADEYGSIEIQLQNPETTETVKKQLAAVFPAPYRVETRYEQNRSLYGVMRMEKWVIYGVLTLILIVAVFNMVGALTMLVLEKQKDIQVLKAMGATNGYIQKIFLGEGALLAASSGGFTGMVLAIIICALQVKYKLVPLQGDSFLIDYYPVKMVATDFILVLVTIMIVALLASWFPSRKAALQKIELKS